jgi:hypothetical protein
MSWEKLQDEVDAGVVLWGYEEAGALVGVMGIQQVQDVTLVGHAYVRTSSQKRGIGGHLLSHFAGVGKRADVDRQMGARSPLRATVLPDCGGDQRWSSLPRQ